MAVQWGYPYSNLFQGEPTTATGTPMSAIYGPTQATNTSVAQPVSGPQNVPSSGGSGGGSNNTASLPQIQDPYAGVRNEINQGYNSYFAQLDQSFNEYLPQQRSSQENIVNSQFNQGVYDLDTQKSVAYNTLDSQKTKAEQNQAKTLRDLSENIRNSFTAGNTYLGAMGAGDSSASNQYAYALTKMGSKQRGDIAQNTANIYNDIDQRRFSVDSFYNSEKNRLVSEKDQKINEIAIWFADAQNQILQSKASGELNKSQDLASLSQNYLNYAINALNTINTSSTNKLNMLNEWVKISSSKTGQASSNIQGQGNVAYNMPNSSQVVGQPQITASGGLYVPTGYGNSNNDDRNDWNFFA